MPKSSRRKGARGSWLSRRRSGRSRVGAMERWAEYLEWGRGRSVEVCVGPCVVHVGSEAIECLSGGCSGCHEEGGTGVWLCTGLPYELFDRLGAPCGRCRGAVEAHG